MAFTIFVPIDGPDDDESFGEERVAAYDLLIAEHRDNLDLLVDTLLRANDLALVLSIYEQLNAMSDKMIYVTDETEALFAYIEGVHSWIFDDLDGLIHTKVTTLVYLIKRGQGDEKEANDLRKLLMRANDSFEEYDDDDYEEYINEVELEDGDYYGEYLSDDSDDELEIEDDEQVPTPTYRFLDDGISPTYDDVIGWMEGVDTPLTDDLELHKETKWAQGVSENTQIRYPKDLDIDQVKADLAEVNAALEKGEVNVESLPKVKTRFCVAQYRGIAYNLLTFGAVSRKTNRERNELSHPVYSSAVFDMANISEGNYYSGEPDDETREALANAAMELQDILLQKREPSEVTLKGNTFECPAFALQDFYSKNYDAFHAAVSEYLKLKKPKLDYISMEDDDSDEEESAPKRGKEKEEDDDSVKIFSGLPSARNPFVSTGNTPRHALRYAYGVKYYQAHKGSRLRPRWRKSGVPERPYSGKVYVSLHPISDYVVFSPLDVVTLNRNGRTCVSVMIANERECTFPAFLPSNRVVFEHIARYPGFHHEDYHEIFAEKYGLNKQEYEAYKELFLESEPHSEERQDAKRALGEWLCRYYETRLIETTRRLAAHNGMVLVYRDEAGLLSLQVPKNVLASGLLASRSGSSSTSKSSNKLNRRRKGVQRKKRGRSARVDKEKLASFERLWKHRQGRRRFREWLVARFNRHAVIGDGNCLFRAVADALASNENFDGIEHTDVRQAAVDEAGRQIENGRITEAVLGEDYFEDMAQVADSALQTERWGTDREAGFIADALNVIVRVYTDTVPNGFTDTIPAAGQDQALGTVILYHQGGDHWIWLTPKSVESLDETYNA